jgi:general secretion pathway protein G
MAEFDTYRTCRLFINATATVCRRGDKMHVTATLLLICWRKSGGKLTAVSTRGMTLLEILVACSIVGILATIAIAVNSNYQEKTKTSKTVTDIRKLETTIKGYNADRDSYPETLADVNNAGLLDPWGRPYEYIKIAGEDPHTVKCRKDKNLHPINTDYDLYSMGKDGKSNLPLTAKASQDDIIRASDGKYVGLASGY